MESISLTSASEGAPPSNRARASEAPARRRTHECVHITSLALEVLAVYLIGFGLYYEYYTWGEILGYTGPP